MDNPNEENRSNLILFETKEKSCFGTITKLDTYNHKVYVDFDRNPHNKPIIARLACRVSLDDLKFAIEKQLEVKLFFEDVDHKKPVIEFIDFSYFDGEDNDCRDIHIKGNKIIFEAETEFCFRCGDVNIRSSSKDDEFIVEAENIKMQAKGDNEISGSVIKLN
ncbi:MAG: hypothetical protein GY714_12485 [Desulfobacterales bacterium]|nr:hypothetical protein [Desulfobacterales bacterium]